MARWKELNFNKELNTKYLISDQGRIKSIDPVSKTSRLINGSMSFNFK